MAKRTTAPRIKDGTQRVYIPITHLGKKKDVCKKCPLERSIGPFVGKGVSKPVLFIVSSKPSSLDMTEGVHFSGSSGIVLSEALRIIGTDRDSCFFTTVIKCYWPEDKNPPNEACTRCSGAFFNDDMYSDAGENAMLFVATDSLSVDAINFTKPFQRLCLLEGLMTASTKEADRKKLKPSANRIAETLSNMQ